MISLDYKGKVVLITGGGRGIGLALTRAFAEAGATVVITYTSKDPSSVAADVSKEFSVPVHVYHCPGEKSDVVDSMVEKIAKDVGEVDVVVANAGISQWKDTIDTTDEDIHAMFATNFYAPIYLSRALVRHWLKLPASVSAESSERGLRDQKVDLGKKILFVSSISGIVAMTPQMQMSYNSSKAALTMAAKSLSGEWAKYGVSINAVAPGYVATDMIESTDGPAADFAKTWKAMTPFGRFASPKELGDFMVLLCSDRTSPFFTGSEVVIDGGYTAY